MRSIAKPLAFGAVIASAVRLWAAQDVLPNHIQQGPANIWLKQIDTGLNSPVALVPAPDNSGRLFVVDQTGQIDIIQRGNILPTPFLNISSQITPLTPSYDERGLLGLAFDPNFATNGKFYTYQSQPVSGTADFTFPSSSPTTANYQNVLSGWQVSSTNPNVADPTSYRAILKIDKSASNHNGGTIAFGPDGNLYMGLGDGGNANDSGAGHNPTTGNAQDMSVVYGKMLRINVNVTPGQGNSANGQYNIPADNPFVSTAGDVKEIFASGLRNPYRFSFDSSNGHIIEGDVGQNTVEEVNNITSGGNYGWPLKEGTFLFNRSNGTVNATNSPGSPAGLIDPLLEYDHADGISVIGGFVYHGSLIPQINGKYIFGDLSLTAATPAGRIFYADLSTGVVNEFSYGTNDVGPGAFIKGFGQDNAGEIYVLTSQSEGPQGTSGSVFLIVPEPAGLCFLILVVPLFARRRVSLPVLA